MEVETNIKRFFKREEESHISYNREIWRNGKLTGSYKSPLIWMDEYCELGTLDQSVIKQLKKLKIGEELPIDISIIVKKDK